MRLSYVFKGLIDPEKNDYVSGLSVKGKRLTSQGSAL